MPISVVFADRVKDTTTTTGTGDITLSGTPPTGFVSFNSAFGTGGQRFAYCIDAGIQPRLVKDKKRRHRVEADELEALYDRILGIAPQTVAEEKAVAAAVRAVERHSEVTEPDPIEVDWISLQADLNAVLALREAYERLIEDEDEEAIIAILMAA